MPSIFTIIDDFDASVQPQNALCLPQFRLKLFRRRHIPPSLSVCGHPPAWIFYGGGAEPSHTHIRSGAYRLRRNLLHLHLSAPNAPSQVNHWTPFQKCLCERRAQFCFDNPLARPCLMITFLDKPSARQSSSGSTINSAFK
jgi:hypothetical protein